MIYLYNNNSEHPVLFVMPKYPLSIPGFVASAVMCIIRIKIARLAKFSLQAGIGNYGPGALKFSSRALLR